MQYVAEYLQLDDTSPSGLVWKVSPSRKCPAGIPALTAVSPQGYRVGRLKGKTLRAHRVIWYLHHGTEPGVIDHIDGDRLNNSITNLRSVSTMHNAHNLTRAKGYTFNKRRGKWQAQITVNYKHLVIGLFETEEAARAAYLAAKKVYHPTAPSY